MNHAKDGEDYSEHLVALRAGQRADLMRIIRVHVDADCPRYIRMDALSEEWAKRNHGQTLKRLNERGGLAPCEAAAIIKRQGWYKMDDQTAIAILKPFAVSAEANR